MGLWNDIDSPVRKRSSTRTVNPFEELQDQKQPSDVLAFLASSVQAVDPLYRGTARHHVDDPFRDQPLDVILRHQEKLGTTTTVRANDIP